MRTQTATLTLCLLFLGCESKTKPVAKADERAAVVAADQRAKAPLVDITAATKLDAVRAAFNAHKSEARFLTLLSPT